MKSKIYSVNCLNDKNNIGMQRTKTRYHAIFFKHFHIFLYNEICTNINFILK